MPMSPRLSIYRWHIPMIASIAHRASGVALILFVPFYLWVLHGMTGTPDDFDQALALLHSPIGRLILWMAATAVVYHFCNGIRFLTLDAGWCESQQMMRLSARIVLFMALLAALLFGWLLW
jgi:succinate dehydrogenase / fumarate reductase cytochrome b subunit